MSDNKKKNEPVAQEPSEGTNANAKNNASNKNTPKNNTPKNNTPKNNAGKNNTPKNNAPTGDLNAKIKDILPLLTKIGELQDKYASASDEEKGKIEKEFEDSKKQAIDLQSEINKTLETMTLDKNVITYFQNSYPDYLKSLKNLHVLNSANKKNGNANAKNGNANANANAKNANANANANAKNANSNSNMNTSNNTNSNMNTSSNTNANEKNVGEPPIVAEENKKLERGTGSRNLTKNNKKNDKKNQKGGKRRTRRNRKN